MIRLDVAKAGAQLFSLNNVFNARVNDGFTPVKVQWVNSTDGNKPLDVKGMRAFLKGQIGQGTITGDRVELEPKSDLVSWADDGSGSQPNGVTLIKLPPQVFTRDGIFYGYIGLTDANGTVITSINIWFNVDQNIMTAGANVPYYLDEIQAALSAVQESTDTMQRAKQEIDSQIDLSNLTFKPEGFENEAALKANYPMGSYGLMLTVDTGHKWLWINGEWRDCGPYQVAGYDEQRLDNDETRIKDNQTRVENIEGTGSLKDIELTDQDGNYLTDDLGVHIGGKRWLIDTDKTLTQSDLPADAKAVGEALVTKPDNYELPILYLYGTGIEKMKSKKDSLTNGLSFSFPRFNVSGKLTGIKVQGASSASLAKKNYTLHLDHKIELIPGYGKQKKYVIKADMTDFSHVRNTGCAKLWGEVRETRIKADDAIKLNDTDYLADNAGNHITGEADPQLSIGGNYGAVDGFPIALYINDKYWGLYTFNVPKDGWMAKMGNEPSHAIVSAAWTGLNKTIQLDGTDMCIEFCGTKDTTWIVSSINALINTLKANYTSASDFDKAVSVSLDINSAIDYYVYSAAIGNTDGILRNYLLQTWDGKKWYIAAYDLDMTFGRTPDLPDWLSPIYNGDSNRRGGTTLTNLANDNLLFIHLWEFHKEDIIARYRELVAGPLSSGAVSTLLTNFAAPIPDALLDQEDKTWPQTSLSGTSNLSQIRWWYMEHINFLNSLVANV